MAELGGGSMSAASQTVPPGMAMSSQQTLSQSDIKREPDAYASSVATVTNGLSESLQSALKRSRPDEVDAEGSEQGGDSKRTKTEQAADGGFGDMDIEAMLKSALGSMSGQLAQTAIAPVPSATAAPTPAPALTSTPSSSTAPPTLATATQPKEASTAPLPATPARATATPTRDVASVKRDTASTADGSAHQVLPGGSPRDQKKMRFSQNCTYIIRSMGLPLLGNFAVQLLYALSEKPRIETLRDIAAVDSELGRVYKALRAAFCHTRKLFSETASLLLPEELDIKELGDQETIQMANMATICASVFEADDVPLIDMHDHFLMTFLPESGALTKDLATLFLSLKFRTLATELIQLPDDQQRGDFLERLFPADLEDQLKQLHPEAPLSEHELEFLKDMMAAKEQLLEAAKTDESRKQLREQYPLDVFRDELSDFLRASADVVLRYAESHGIEIPVEEETVIEEQVPAAADSAAFAAMSENLASMLSAAIASSAAAPPPVEASHAASSAPEATGAAQKVEQPSLEAAPNAEGVSKLIQEAVQRNAALAQSAAHALPQTPQTPQAARAGSQGSTPAPQANSTALPQENGASAPADGGMDLSGLTMLIKEKLGQDAQNAQPAVPAAATAAAAYHPQPVHSPVAAANAALTSMRNTLASHLAHYQGHTPSFAYQPVQLQSPPPPPPPPAGNSSNASANGPMLPPNQSSPSVILYQQARQAAASKTQGHTRREGLHSTRRPWSPDEEQALMAGLDMVKGPHWSQILQLFGANGTISDILKDRSQVQLKDKARNLKLFFLKANTEMPYYLKCVTGELKTRAPSQAARKEAEERARATNKEEQARVQGIMTLAGGLQDKNQAGAAAAAGGAAALAAAPSASAAAVTNGAAGAAGATVAAAGPTGAASTLSARLAAAGTAQLASPQNLQLQQQIQQQLQRQLQQAQQPQAGTNSNAARPPGTATGIAQYSAADVALAAARSGLTATAQALTNQQINGTAAGRPVLMPGATRLAQPPAPVRPATASPAPTQPLQSMPPQQHASPKTAPATPSAAPLLQSHNPAQAAPTPQPASQRPEDRLWMLEQHVQTVSKAAEPAPAATAASDNNSSSTSSSSASTSTSASSSSSGTAVAEAATPAAPPAAVPAAPASTINSAAAAPAVASAPITEAPLATRRQWQQEETPEEAVMRRLLAPPPLH